VKKACTVDAFMAGGRTDCEYASGVAAGSTAAPGH